MNQRIPISLLVDDSCPLVHVFQCHHHPPFTRDGRPLLETIPNAFLERFCDVVETYGIAGKLSIVPSPGGRGDVVRGIEAHDPQLTHQWLNTVQRRLAKRFDFCSEGITHHLTLDLNTMQFLEQNENAWSQTQTRLLVIL